MIGGKRDGASGPGVGADAIVLQDGSPEEGIRVTVGETGLGSMVVATGEAHDVRERRKLALSTVEVRKERERTILRCEIGIIVGLPVEVLRRMSSMRWH